MSLINNNFFFFNSSVNKEINKKNYIQLMQYKGKLFLQFFDAFFSYKVGLVIKTN